MGLDAQLKFVLFHVLNTYLVFVVLYHYAYYDIVYLMQISGYK